MADRRVHQGWLLIADITGYTQFLTGTELEHAQDILEELTSLLLSHVRAPLKLVKLEGDAVFAVAPSTADAGEGREILARVEDCYHDFRARLFDLSKASTCTCTACRNAPNLDLKFFVHHGEWVEQRLAGTEDVAGPDVILVHRLLKNGVTDRHGVKAYALLTDPARRRIAGPVDVAEHGETYEHLGDVPCGVYDLTRVYEQQKASRVVRVSPEDADVAVEYDVPVPPAVAWDWHTDPAKRAQYEDGQRFEVFPTAGRVGVGTEMHCHHGGGVQRMKIVDWRPYAWVTTESPTQLPMPGNLWTVEITPTEAGSHVALRMRTTSRMPWVTLFVRFVFWASMTGVIRQRADKLVGLLRALPPDEARAAG